ncbi:MAG TPA: hypothetical protein VF076_07185 [Acidimicrobiales bacterium]
MSYNPYDPYGGYPTPQTEQAIGNAADMAIKEFEAKYKLGNAQLSNAFKIAQLQSGTSRYATDATREVGLANIEQARQEMLQIGIPKLALDKWVAEKQQALAESELTFKKDQWAQQFGLQQGALTGYYGNNPTMAREQQQFQQGVDVAGLTGFYGGGPGGSAGGGTPTMAYQQFQAAQAELARRFGFDVGTATGVINGQPTLAYQQFQSQREELARRFGLSEQEFAQSTLEQDRRFGLDVGQQTGYVNGAPTLAREQFGQTQLEQARRYGLDVAQFGAQLASTPDTYYQSQRFNAVDLPMLLGMAAGQMPEGGPTPGIATMGQYLGPGMPAAPGAPPQGPAAGSPLSPQEQSRLDQIVAQRQQLALAGQGDVGPQDLAELQRYQARGGQPTSVPGAPAPAPGAAASPLSPQEQARAQAISDRRVQIQQTGAGDVSPDDAAELARYQARGWGSAPQTDDLGNPIQPRAGGDAFWDQYTGPSPYGGGFGGGGPFQGGGGAGAGGGPIDQYGNPIGGGRGGDQAVGIEPWQMGGGAAALKQRGGSWTLGPGGQWVPVDTSGPVTNAATTSSGPYPQSYGGSSPQPYRTPAYGGSGGYTRQIVPQGGGYGAPAQDPRTRQISQVAKAVPPSPYQGLSPTDASALHLMENIYRQGGQSLDPGAYSRLKAQGRTGFLSSAGKLLGYSPQDLDAQFQAYRPAQGSSALAG